MCAKPYTYKHLAHGRIQPPRCGEGCLAGSWSVWDYQVMWILPISVWLAAGTPSNAMSEGLEALKVLRAREAIILFERAKKEGPLDYADHTKLYEQLGTAYAYAGETDEAVEAFRMLLLLNPTVMLSYTISPKVTRAFEQARQESAGRRSLTVVVHHSRTVSQGNRNVEFDLELLANPHDFIQMVRLAMIDETGKETSKTVLLSSVASKISVSMPIDSFLSAEGTNLGYYLIGYDGSGNEVYLLGSRTDPRRVFVQYETKQLWYKTWWFWGAVVGLAALGAGAAALTSRGEKITERTGARIGFTIPGLP